MIDDVCRCFICGAETGTCSHLEKELRPLVTVPQDEQERAARREYIARVVKHRRFKRDTTTRS